MADNVPSGFSENPQPATGVSPAPTQPTFQFYPQTATKPSRHTSKIAILLAIIVVVAFIFLILKLFPQVRPLPSKNVTAPSKPTGPSNLFDISNCTNITKPGTYYLISNIFTREKYGACIKISSDNVVLEGNYDTIKGSGPFVFVPPFSYGIELDHVKNVTVKDVDVFDFSYGIFVNNSTDSNIQKVNSSGNTISNIYLLDSSQISVAKSTFMKSSSSQGGIFVKGGGGNYFSNDASLLNLYYGAVINSTNNTFEHDSIVSNKVGDLICYGSSGFVKANLFTNTSCESNIGCESASCSVRNLPVNLSEVVLKPGLINSSGTITGSGNYTLGRNLSAYDFYNVSSSINTLPCLVLHASNAHLDCNGHTISNFQIGIYVNDSFGSSISNCNLVNNTKGLLLLNTYNLNLTAVNVSSSAFGLYFSNSTGGFISKVSASNSLYGLFSNFTTGVSFSSIKLTGNEYGLAFYGGSGDAFINGSAYNNSKMDFYCTPSTYNSTVNLVEKMNCGVTDCKWVSCRSFVLPPLTAYPITSCMHINLSGTYILENNILTNKNCFTVSASKVTLDCYGHTLTGSGSNYAFSASNVSSLILKNCKVVNFGAGISLNGINDSIVTNISINSTARGFSATNSKELSIVNVSVGHYSAYGFLFSNLTNSSITKDSAVFGLNNASGFIFENSTKNLVSGDVSNRNPSYGFLFDNFLANNVYNNSAFGNAKYDYYCSKSSNGFYADINGINKGDTANLCRWLVLLPSVYTGPQCQAVTSSSLISLSSDMLYPYGSTCFYVYNTKGSSANYTTINCNNHTVLALHGGSFVTVVNSSNVKIENCILKNFTTAIASSGTSTQVQHNTVLNSSTGIAISLRNLSTVAHNLLINDSIGINASETSFDTVLGNIFENVKNDILWNNSTSSKLYSNIGNKGIIGLLFDNSLQNTITNNVFENMSKYGIECLGSSTSSTANHDFGNNTCSSEFNCLWITSPGCK